MFRENGRGGELPRSFDRVDEAALVEQGMTPGMVVGDGGFPTLAATLSRSDLDALRRELPNVGLIEERHLPPPIVRFHHGAINPEPQEGLDYWVWWRGAAATREEWRPARFRHGSWWLVGQDEGHLPGDVKFWRGPMVPPEAPTPAQVDAALGRKRLVHEVHDLEASG